MSAPRIVHSIEEVRSIAPRNAALTLGVFDGVHVGHEKIIAELVASRKRAEIEGCYLITFDPHPLVVTHSKVTPPMLTTVDERVHLLRRFDLDGILVLKFDERLAALDYRTFLQRYLLRAFNMRLLVLGFDCHFGKNREGSPDKIREESARSGFSVKLVSAVHNDGQAVSSTAIRNSLMEGDLDRANRLLGHPYLISGTVIRGHGQGRDLGFPTANLSIADPYKLWPPRGVYAVAVEYGGRTMPGMMNVGRAPTMKSLGEDAREVEVHVFDFNEDLYGERLWVHCRAYLRDEKRFPSPEGLMRQLELDKTRALEYFADASGETQTG